MKKVQAGFEKAAVFESLKENNAMGHMEVYALLRQEFLSRKKFFRLLDLGCGDTSDIVSALQGAQITQYTGVDVSATALEKAQRETARLSCNARLVHGNYDEVLTEESAGVDIVWMGLFLHHLPPEKKRDFLQTIYTLLAPQGVLLAHDPLLGEQETRDEFLLRLEGHARRHWTFLPQDDLDSATRHWRGHGIHASFADLRRMALEVGFADVHQMWADPFELYGVVRFSRAL